MTFKDTDLTNESDLANAIDTTLQADGEDYDPEKPGVRLKASYMAKLNADQQRRQRAFRDYRVTHPALTKLVKELLPLLMTDSETNVIVVTGATGVGKSTLTKVMLKKLVDGFDPLMEDDPSVIPLVYSEARRNGNVRNGFGRLYRKLVGELYEPGMGLKVPYVMADGHIRMHSRVRETADDLRDVLEECLEGRKTRVVVIDEAAQLVRFGRPEDVMDTVRSLANTTTTKWMLVGSFDLYEILETSGQIARRTALLNLERYRRDNAEDCKAFKNVVKMLQKAWPCEEKPNFTAVSDDLLDLCLGCVGLLKTFMLDAANLQMRQAGEKWDYEFMLKSQKAIGLRKVIEDEIERGEKRVQNAVYGNSIWDKSKFADIVRRMAEKPKKKQAELGVEI